MVRCGKTRGTRGRGDGETLRHGDGERGGEREGAGLSADYADYADAEMAEEWRDGDGEMRRLRAGEMGSGGVNFTLESAAFLCACRENTQMQESEKGNIELCDAAESYEYPTDDCD